MRLEAGYQVVWPGDCVGLGVCRVLRVLLRLG